MDRWMDNFSMKVKKEGQKSHVPLRSLKEFGMEVAGLNGKVYKQTFSQTHTIYCHFYKVNANYLLLLKLHLLIII